MQAQTMMTAHGDDPAVPDWANLILPDTWADQLDFRRPRDWLRFFASIIGRSRQPVRVPADLPQTIAIPKYVLQEFHGLPNGNYSKRITRGYINGFDRCMLGAMGPARQRIAHALRDCQSVLDAGCAGGRTAQALREAGVADVWGLDASPYLLQHAARDVAGVRFVQGIVEDTDFRSGRFDGIAVCFLLHEMPPRYLARAMKEFHRLLKPKGLLAICEPSPSQWREGILRLLRNHGWQGLYFRALARFVHEPFACAWHALETTQWLDEFGFEVIEDEVGMPLRHLLLRRR